jgi:RNA polymerase sigma-70 factor, ECF subfamily
MNVMTYNLPKLIQRCRDGDPQAIEDLFHTYQEKVFRLAYSLLDNGKDYDVNDEAEEATQDVFISALAALDGFHGESSFSTWLYSITLNVCRSRLRKRMSLNRLKMVLQELFFLVPKDPRQVEEGTIHQEHNAIVWHAIQQLDEKHRLPIILHYYHDFSVAEIAEIMNIRSGTVLSRLFTARDRLRIRLYGELDILESQQPSPGKSRSNIP